MAVARTGDGRGCVRGSRGWPWPCRGSCARRRGRPRASCAGDVVAAPRRARPWLRRAGKVGPVPGEAVPAAEGSRARRLGKPRSPPGEEAAPPVPGMLWPRHAGQGRGCAVPGRLGPFLGKPCPPPREAAPAAWGSRARRRGKPRRRRGKKPHLLCRGCCGRATPGEAVAAPCREGWARSWGSRARRRGKPRSPPGEAAPPPGEEAAPATEGRSRVRRRGKKSHPPLPGWQPLVGSHR
jgi:hypothetical protein